MGVIWSKNGSKQSHGDQELADSMSNPLRRPIREDTAGGTELWLAESTIARRQARLRLGWTAIIVGHVSNRCGVLPLRFLQMALRSGLKPDGATLTMPVVDGATTGLLIMVVSSLVSSRRQCKNIRKRIITNRPRLYVDSSVSERQVTWAAFYLLRFDSGSHDLLSAKFNS